MGKGLIFFSCACCILVLTIVNLSIGPIITGRADISGNSGQYGAMFITGNNSKFYNELKNSIKNAEKIDIIVSFLMESGVKLIFDDLKNSNAKIRILTSDYLNITQPPALYLLKSLGEKLDLRFYNNQRHQEQSFLL